MLYSMTGFGTAAKQQDGTAVCVELKSVNNRFFKLSLRMSDGHSALESKIETLLRNAINRGTLNVNVRIQKERAAGDYKICEPVLRGYYEQLVGIGMTKDSVRLTELLTLPGVIETASNTGTADDSLWDIVESTLQQALDALQTMRRIEGAAMSEDLTDNVRQLRTLCGSIEVLAPQAAPQYRVRLKERMETLMKENNLSFNDTDLIREVAVYADRCDISEEIVRFKSHLEQFTAVLTGTNGSCPGRKLDFLTQELFREVNTMGAKANDAEMTKYVVEMKTVIEKIREMVQNAE